MTRIHSRRRQLVAFTSAVILLTSLSWINIFSKSGEKRSVARVYLPSNWLVIEAIATLLPPIGDFSALAHSSRSFDRCPLSHWHFFAALSADSSAVDTWRTSDPLAQQSTEPVMFPALRQVHRGVLVHSGLQYPKSRFTCQGFVVVTRSLSSCGR